MRKIIFGIIALITASCSLEDAYDDMRGGLTSALEYSIGDTGPGGGIIFYVADGRNGRPYGFTVEGFASSTGAFSSYTAYYLEAAPQNSGNAQWGAYGTLISGVTTFTSNIDELANAIGNGRKDTRTIVAHLGTTESGRAAQIAAAATFGGRNDWFLPSSGELNQLYINRAAVGNMWTGYFWSSSQNNRNFACIQDFDSGAMTTFGVKNITDPVRAIRAF